MKFALAALILAALITQFQQTRRANGRYASDERNPFAYVPTRRDVEALETWLGQLKAALPPGSLETVAVAGVDYWPLPWYLRSFDRIGYWKTASPELIPLPLVFALPDVTGEVSQVLEKSHVPLPRGLRTGVPMHLFVRKDLWKQWMEAGRR